MFDVNITVTLDWFSNQIYVIYLIGEQGHDFKNLLKRGLRKTIIYSLVKPNYTKKLEQYRWCVPYIIYQVFLKNGKVDLKNKILNFNINFQTLFNFFTKTALKQRTKVILTSSNLILQIKIRFC